MADRFPGGVISKTPPTVVAPVDGEGGSASGVWTLDEQLGLQKAGNWPGRVLPRELYSWGENNIGQLGDGTSTNRSSAVQVGSLVDWAQVSSSVGDFSVSIKRDGTIWAWGNNNAGRLGDGTTISKSSPVQIGALTTWSQASAGQLHALAVTTGGELYAWGSGSEGRLGDNTTTNKSSPVQIDALTNWLQVSGGDNHSVALKTDGTLWAWGRNSSGELGNNSVTGTSSPIQVGSLTNWSQVAGGGSHCAAAKTDGTLWTWGANLRGNLGDGTVIARSSPVQVGALTNWSKVSAGGNLTHAIKTDATLWAWGMNEVVGFEGGFLGDGTRANRSSPVLIGALSNWLQVSTGANHSAAVRTDGTLWTWGRNHRGQLGQNNTIDRSSPVQVGSLVNWFQASTGIAFTTAITRG